MVEIEMIRWSSKLKGSRSGRRAGPPISARACSKRPRSRRTAEQRGELAPPNAGHGGLPPVGWHLRQRCYGRTTPVYRTLNLPQSGRQVLEADLNSSESRWAL